MDIEVRKTQKKGNGVFANRDFKEGEIIEICPTIIFSKLEAENHLENTKLKDYWFYWADDDNEAGAIPLGYGVLYNHSSLNNALAERDYIGKRIVIKAIKDIPKDSEINIKYNMLWFNEME